MLYSNGLLPVGAGALALALIGACGSGEQDTNDEAVASALAAYSPPACDSTCVSNGTLVAMNAAATKYGFPRWFVYATVNRESTFEPAATNTSGSGDCATGYGLTQLTCSTHSGVKYPENLSAPNQANTNWHNDMRIDAFCSETGLCPWIDMTTVSALASSSDRLDPVKNLDRYFSGYAAPAYWLEKARAPQESGESAADFHNRILRRVAWHWRYGHYASFSYPSDPSGYFSGSDAYRWDKYAATYRAAVEAIDGVWDGNVCKPPYSASGCGTTTPGTTTPGTTTPGTTTADFESGSTDGFSFSAGGLVTAIASTTDKAYSGSSSLAISVAGGTSSSPRIVATTSVPGAGKTVTMHVWVPSTTSLAWIQVYVQEGAAGGWKWTTATKTRADLGANAWNTLTVTVPTTATSVASVGLQLGLSGTWSGTVYLDDVTW